MMHFFGGNVKKNLRARAHDQAGFTFIEIMIVIIIIGFLASIVAPQIIGRLGKAKSVTAETQVRNVEGALDQYWLDNGDYPSSEQGLQALVTKPTISPVPKNWSGPYIKREVPKDPWGNDFVYKCPGEHNTGSYDLSSLGKDGQVGGSGENADITNWSNTEM